VPACQWAAQKEVTKETYYSVKRDLLQCQKRPTTPACQWSVQILRTLVYKYIYYIIIYLYREYFLKICACVPVGGGKVQRC
jgi:hypothetical protein